MCCTKDELLNKIDNIMISRLDIEISKDNQEIYNTFTNNFLIEITESNQKNLITLRHSIKLANISFKVKEAVSFICENALALGMSIESLNPWKIVLLIICDLSQLVSNLIIKLDDNMLEVVKFLDKHDAYRGINLVEVYSNFKSKVSIDKALKNLVDIKTIELKDEKIYLKEKIFIKN